MTNPLDTVELPDEVIDMSALDESLNVLVYGPSGVGKTVFSGGAHFIIATEKGLVSAKRQGSKAKAWRVDEWKDFVRAYEFVKDMCDNDVLSSDHWVVIDSAPEMQQKILRDILDYAVANNEERDPDIPAIQDHQKWQNMFKRYVRLFNDLPVNVLWTATPMSFEDDEGNTVTIPDIQGKGHGMSSWLCAQMSAVGYMKKVRKKLPKKKESDPDKFTELRRIIWQHTSTVFAKDRSDMCGRFTEGLSLMDVHKLMNTVPDHVTADDAPGVTPVARKPRKAASVAEKAEEAPPSEEAAPAETGEAEEPDVSDDDIDDDEDED